MILQVNQFKVRPPDHHEVKPQGILPKAENVGAQIEQENGQYDQLVGQDDHDQIINETGDNEKALFLDPHTKVAAEDVHKVHIFTILISPALVSIRISSK